MDAFCGCQGAARSLRGVEDDSPSGRRSSRRKPRASPMMRGTYRRGEDRGSGAEGLGADHFFVAREGSAGSADAKVDRDRNSRDRSNEGLRRHYRTGSQVLPHRGPGASVGCASWSDRRALLGTVRQDRDDLGDVAGLHTLIVELRNSTAEMIAATAALAGAARLDWIAAGCPIDRGQRCNVERRRIAPRPPMFGGKRGGIRCGPRRAPPLSRNAV